MADKGPLSFEKSCKNITMVKPILKKRKIKKTKSVSNLGERMEITPSFYACITHRLSNKEDSSLKAAETMASSGDDPEPGEFLPSFSNYDFDIIICNNRTSSIVNSVVGKKIVNSVSNLGVVSGVDDGMSTKLVEFLEIRNKGVL